MKIIIILLLFLANISSLFAQDERSVLHSRDYYLKKSEKQNVSGNILIGSGIFCVLMGLLSNDEGGDAFGPSPLEFGVTIGVFNALAGIYFKIRSKKWKTKAAELSAGAGKLPQVSIMGASAMHIQPALVLRIGL